MQLPGGDHNSLNLLVSNISQMFSIVFSGKYPEIKQLMGSDPLLKFKVMFLVLLQMIGVYLVHNQPWWIVILMSYVYGGTINHSLTLAIHEIAHNLAFGHGKPLTNRALGMFANLPLGLPMSVSFKKYHLEHHRYQGDEKKDVDIPCKFEGNFFNSTLRKLIWVILQPYFYAFRPLFIRPMPVSYLEVINFIVQFSFDAVLYKLLGIKAIFFFFFFFILFLMASHMIQCISDIKQYNF